MLLLPQRYEFSSKSQQTRSECTGRSVVVATAKVRIFKQITTNSLGVHRQKCCCCYRKGTNFQANHNTLGSVPRDNMLLLLPQRYEFSSKSQLHSISPSVVCCCCCYRKGTNFQANHNNFVISTLNFLLLLLPQRYEFSSKSQRLEGAETTRPRCCCYRKGTNFQANHNYLLNIFDVFLLLLLPQRYEFSSKSQPIDGKEQIVTGCCCYRKGTNFQANHNARLRQFSACGVVVATAKVRIFKQVTTRY